MPEVLDIRELGGEEPRPDRAGVPAEAEGKAESAGGGAPPRWRSGAAVSVVVVLSLAVAYVFTVGGAGGRRAKVVDATSPAERAARAALDAWATFASTGDVEALRGTFDPSGPQLERLKAEAPGVKARAAPGVPYRFSATVLRSSAGLDSHEQVVGAEVVVSRPGETDQRFIWELVMRSTDGRWLLWTVHDRAAASNATTTGGAP